MNKPAIPVNEALERLGLTARDIERTVQSVPDQKNIWQARSEAVRNLVRDARKRQLQRFHPDVCRDPDATEKAQKINQAADMLMQFRVMPPPPPPPQIVFFDIFGGNTSTTTTSINVNIDPSTSTGWF